MGISLGGWGGGGPLKHRGYQSWGVGWRWAVETSWVSVLGGGGGGGPLKHRGCQSQERGIETSWVEMKSAKIMVCGE